jgi:predicted acylesterase/phospholipase RssA
MATTVTSGAKDPKRAICLGGGGPALGLHIGALQGLKDCGIDFRNKRDVWALSCIGAWVGIVYNQAKSGSEIDETFDFFHKVFRDDKSYQSFPTNTIFAPDWAGCAEAAWDFLLEPDNYRNAVLPRHMLDSWLHTMSHLRDRRNWGRFNEGDFNRWTFNHVLAVHPGVRFLFALLYKAEVDGRARLHYKDSKFLKGINFKMLDGDEKPYIFHNAFNFRTKNIDLFANNPTPRGRHPGHKPITPESLCACSALPFVEKVVKVGGDYYCEGAMLDTVNFKRLLLDHHKPDANAKKDDSLHEIWINRIVDVGQIRQPRNQHDALGNLCQMFAATVGEDDIKLFKFHVRQNNRRAEEEKNRKATNAPPNTRRLAHHELDPAVEKPPEWSGVIVEVPVDDTINYEWSHSNLERARDRGRIAASAVYKLYKKYVEESPIPVAEWNDGVLVIPEDLRDDEIEKVLTDDAERNAVMRPRGRATGNNLEAQIKAVLSSLGLNEERIRALSRVR